MDIQTAIRTVCDRRDLSQEQMRAVMRIIMTGEATPAQIGGFLVGLRMKGETVEEISAAAEVMRELATHVGVSGPHVVDTCGTGGDGINTFNISTASAFVVAAAGGKVAKHGNRSVSSHSGSADVLEAAGVSLDLTPAQVAQCIDEVGVGFMFAPKHHGAMKHAIGPRREMGVRTIFNLLGPLTNPASAPHQMIGVFSGQWVEPLAQVLQRLGSEHVLVVHAEDGMDEISIETPTRVAELKDGAITSYTVSPDQLGFKQGKVTDLAVESAEESLSIIESGTRKALECIASGAAREKLQALVGLSRKLAG
jgi:anthranilate phosphoribosyltransferase